MKHVYILDEWTDNGDHLHRDWSIDRTIHFSCYKKAITYAEKLYARYGRKYPLKFMKNKNQERWTSGDLGSLYYEIRSEVIDPCI